MSCVGTLAVTSLLFLPFPQQVLSAEPEIGSITAVRGIVTLKRPGSGNHLVVREGTAFKIGDVIETGGASAAQLTLADDSFMNMGPDSAVRVSQFSFDPVTDRRTTIIRLIEGKTRFIVYKLRFPGSSFAVEAGNALVTTGGLADFLALTSSGQAELIVLDRGLKVKNSLPYVVGEVRVEVNQRTIVKEKSPPTVPVVITPQERRNWLKDLK